MAVGAGSSATKTAVVLSAPLTVADFVPVAPDAMLSRYPPHEAIWLAPAVPFHIDVKLAGKAVKCAVPVKPPPKNNKASLLKTGDMLAAVNVGPVDVEPDPATSIGLLVLTPRSATTPPPP